MKIPDFPIVCEARSLDHDFPIFCDGLRLTQDFPYALPKISGGHILASDDAGELQWQTTRWADARDNFDKIERKQLSTSLLIRTNGNRLEASGNPGAILRNNNAWNYTLEEQFTILNRILREAAGIEFTPATRKHNNMTNGARLTLLDTTTMIDTGLTDPRDIEKLFATLAAKRKRGKAATVYDRSLAWTQGRTARTKFYDKAKHLKEKNRLNDETLEAHFGKSFILRAEIQLRTDGIKYHNLGDYNASDDYEQRLAEVFNTMVKPLLRGLRLSEEELQEMPKHFRKTLAQWKCGMAFRHEMSERTFQTHRAYLRRHAGIDIAAPAPEGMRKNTEGPPVNFKPAPVPDWYYMPPIDKLIEDNQDKFNRIVDAFRPKAEGETASEPRPENQPEDGPEKAKTA